MSEADLQLKLENSLSEFFHVGHEVWDVANKNRIDIMLIHRSDLDRKYPIGIEVKVDEKKTGAGLARWIQQSSRYSETEWADYGKALIVTYPQISEKYLKEGDMMHKHVDRDGDAGQAHNVSTFLSQFGIGELQVYNHHDGKTYCRIVWKGQRIWDMKDDDLRTNNYDTLVR